MEINMVIGVSVTVVTLALMSYLTIRSRSIIDRLSQTRPKSIRDAMRDLKK